MAEKSRVFDVSCYWYNSLPGGSEYLCSGGGGGLWQALGGGSGGGGGTAHSPHVGIQLAGQGGRTAQTTAPIERWERSIYNIHRLWKL